MGTLCPKFLFKPSMRNLAVEKGLENGDGTLLEGRWDTAVRFPSLPFK